MPGKFSRAIHSRQRKGLNTIILIVGARGVGKSYLSLRLGEIYDKHFSVENVTFSIEEFLQQIDVLRKRPWSWLIFDEIGLEVAARDFMSMVNKVMSYVAQSFRYTKLNLCCVCPDPDMVDIHVRKLADFLILVTNRGHARVFRTKMNPFRSGGYYTPLFCELKVNLPSNALQDTYEAKRHIIMEEKYAQYQKEIQSQGYQPQVIDKRTRAFEIIEQNKGKTTSILVALLTSEMGVGRTTAYNLINEHALKNKASA
jgi:hypothetical protein